MSNGAFPYLYGKLFQHPCLEIITEGNVVTYCHRPIGHVGDHMDRPKTIEVHHMGERCENICKHGVQCGLPKGHEFNCQNNIILHGSGCFTVYHNGK